jgi:hypothetical protein
MITIVSGLPRSGTSMLMQMLAAGGLPALTDNLRAADADNLKGYFELEQVKQLGRDSSWIPQARGKAVKIISALLQHLPAGEDYRVIFIHRDINEVLASQRSMLIRRGEPSDAVDDVTMAAHFARHLAEVAAWLAARPDIRALHLDHAAVVADPRAAASQINALLGNILDAGAMAAAVEPTLHRQRRPPARASD